MTAVAESLMTTEQFEELARTADHIAEGVRLEFIDGKLVVKAVPDGDHGCMKPVDVKLDTEPLPAWVR
ncbi:hypothetical protein [Nocardia sp. NPDC052112]|uniref:hypothetical protein n=1 Tax=Nocardia sp. NPDC052112 TaxID=3155646 RepID=UPI00342B62DB